jgi:molecular chaperone DnaK
MAIIGIDLGTTYSAVARCVNGVPEIISLEGEATLPSVVGLQKNGKIAVGKTAKRNQAKFPHNTIVEVKRKMGTNEKVSLGEKSFTPQEISAMILRRIKELAEAELGESVTGAVISCPAYFKDPQRQATKEAGQIAGLEVLRIINEPTAAAYAYGVRLGNDDQQQLFVVYDLGGGTFDVTVIRMEHGLLEVIGTGGDPRLGGGDFDDRIVDWMLEHLGKNNPGYLATLTDEKRAALRMRLKSYAEEGKKALCDSKTGEPYQFQITNVDSFQARPVMFNETLTMARFDELIGDLMKNSLKWVDEALKVPKSDKYNYTEANLTAILLVGGSTRVPLVRKLIEERFPSTPVWGRERGINPDEIVALGAAVVAAEEDPENDEVGAKILVDVTGHTLSVAVFDDRKQRELLHPIIEKETPIPCAKAHEFSSAGEFQEVCKVRIYQGEGTEIDPQQVTMIGEFLIRIKPIKPPTPLQVGLDLDANGILVAHAIDKLSGQKVECRINYEGSAKMSPEDLKRKKGQLEAQLNAVIGQTANPLDEQAAAAPSAWAPPSRVPAPPPATAPVGPPVTQAPPVDTATLLNPIMRPLYQKAINSFARVPADRQGALMQLVMDIETAARAGDQQRVMSFYPQLSHLLEGVA